MRPRAAAAWVWLALLAIGVVAVGIVFVALAAEDEREEPRERREQVRVPEVAGLDLATAGARVEERDLVADSFPVDDDSEAGLVIAQDPAPEAAVERESTVRLNVSKGTGELAAASVPDLVGADAGDARATAWQNAFTTRTVLRDAPAPADVGEVLAQEPAPGTAAEALTQITLYVGR